MATFEFHGFSIPTIGRIVKDGSEHFAFVTVDIIFKKDQPKTLCKMSTSVSVECDESWTIDQIHENALSQVRQLLSLAKTETDGQTPTDLYSRSHEPPDEFEQNEFMPDLSELDSGKENN